jgi:hypothetical protein
MKHTLEWLLAPLVVVGILSTGLTACSGAKDRAATRGASTNTLTTIPPGQTILGDGDADNPNDVDGDGNRPSEAYNSKEFTDDDHEPDTRTKESYDYPDKDDSVLLSYGRAADASDGDAITKVVKKYYADATTGQGAKACHLLSSRLAGAVAEDYGRAPGPSYLRGGTTCPAILSLLFAHIHSQLVATINVTQVRISGSLAEAFLGSVVLHASEIPVERQGHAWRIAEPLANLLP